MVRTRGRIVDPDGTIRASKNLRTNDGPIGTQYNEQERISERSTTNTRALVPYQESSLSNSQPTTLDNVGEEDPFENMSDGNNELPGESRMAITNGPTGGNSQVSKETPISFYPTLTYGLQETHTTILPWTGWFSIVRPDKVSPIQVQLRPNRINDMFTNTVSSIKSSGNFRPNLKGIYNVPFRGHIEHEQGSVYPRSFGQTNDSNDTNYNTTTERPQWRDYWAQLYDYYTVLSCEYTLTCENPESAQGSDLVCIVQEDSYSDTTGSFGNVMPATASLAEMLAFKGMKVHRIFAQDANRNGQNNVTIIKGIIKPGSIRRNIRNDGDVQTWTKTDGTFPKLHEQVTFNFFQAPTNPWKSGTPGNNASDPIVIGDTLQGYANCQLEVKYIVQFKDLKGPARYPSTAWPEANSITQQIGAPSAPPPTLVDQVLYKN